EKSTLRRQIPQTLHQRTSGLSIRSQSHRVPCPFPCNGNIKKLIVEKKDEISTPRGFGQQYQYECSLCGATFLGTSKKNVSKLLLNHVQLKAWRIKRAHGKWVEKGWRGRKYVFDGYW